MHMRTMLNKLTELITLAYLFTVILILLVTGREIEMNSPSLTQISCIFCPTVRGPVWHAENAGPSGMTTV